MSSEHPTGIEFSHYQETVNWSEVKAGLFNADYLTDGFEDSHGLIYLNL